MFYVFEYSADRKIYMLNKFPGLFTDTLSATVSFIWYEHNFFFDERIIYSFCERAGVKMECFKSFENVTIIVFHADKFV